MSSNNIFHIAVLQLIITGVVCFVNVAHGPALQAQVTMSGQPKKPAWSKNNVVDGNTDQTATGGSCAIMDFSKMYTSVWLNVQLKRLFNVGYIEIYFLEDTALYRSAGFSVYAFYTKTFDPSSPTSEQNFVYHHDPLSGCPNSIQNITVNRQVQQIVITIDRPPEFKSACPGENNTLYTSVEICEIIVMGCDKERYHSALGCGNECPVSCKNKHCDAFNGTCLHGCPDPNALTDDCIVCPDGNYVGNGGCLNCPPHCLKGKPCDKLTGKCTGCNNHWQGEFCQICSSNFYGNECKTPCGHCRDNALCNNVTGFCPNGCQGHWKENRCDVCSDHFYGRDCNIPCGHCKNNHPCSSETGYCPNTCQNQWKGLRCDTCREHFYGIDCNTPCGHCRDNDVCNNATGQCPKGCQTHWKGDKCNLCSDRFYGTDCKSPCGHCRNNDVCNNVTGHCANGCQSHWTGGGCDVCEDGYYNNNCTGQCGHCIGDKPCDKRNGTCVNGCIQNFQQPLCQECVKGYYTNNCTTRCGNCSNEEFCDTINGNCASGCQPNFQPPLCHDYVTSITDDSKPNTGAIVGGVVSVLVAFVALGVVGVLYKRRRGRNSRNEHYKATSTGAHRTRSSKGQNNADLSENSQRVTCEEYINVTMTADDEGYYNTTTLNTFIQVDDLQRDIQERGTGENNVLQSEYKRLPAGNISVCNEGKKQENMVKNRFKTTFPYDHSRVILSEKWNDGDHHYINANFIKDFNGKRTYIAAQGPKNNTLTDFWRMIWQENVRFIVMLTNIVENGKNKCTQYWPEKDDSLEVGPCKMQLQKETTYAFYTYRKLMVQNTKSTVKRTITQYHYTAWPDHWTPEEIGLVQFHRAVTRKYQSDGLMLVHCSAGVGRTGTFIGLDSLLKQGKETGKINVFEFVKQMREDRMTMVQTPDQYIFLHKALLFGFQDKDTVICESDIPTKLQALLHDTSPLNQRDLYKEYKFLQTVKPVFEDKEKEDGMKPENKNKNSNMNAIPVSKYRPYLMSYVKGRNDYINAVCVPSFSNLGAFILTQIPLPDTQVDLWTLCVDHDVKAIIILTENNEEIPWIPKKGCSDKCTPYTLNSGDTGSSISGLTQDSLAILTDGTKHDVDVFHIPFKHDNAMLKGVEMLLAKGKEGEFTSVVISKDGAGPVGIFCVLHNTLQQLRIDGEVDILTTVRLIQTRQPEVITKMEEYRRCYELVSLSASEDGIYANM